MGTESALYREVVREINELENLLFLTEFLGKRLAILLQLKSHLEA